MEQVGLRAGAQVRHRYELEARLATGGEGEVWRARDLLGGGRPVALKALPGAGPAALAREFAALAPLRHPHLGAALALEHDPATDRTYLVAPWYPGGDLDAACERPTPIEERLRAAVAALRALVFLHEQGVVHGDVKPQNVVFDENGAARLIDLGLARVRRAGGAAAGQGPAGTPAYLAPELLRGASPDVASDLYSFGVLLHRVLTGALPFPGDAAAQLRARAEGRRPELGPFRPPLEALEPLVRQLLADRPEERPGSAFVALRGLLAALPAGLDEPVETLEGVLARADVPADLPPHDAATAALRALVDALGAPPGAAGGASPRVHVVAGASGSGRSALLRRIRDHALFHGLDAPDLRPPERPAELAGWLGLTAPPDTTGGRADPIDRLGQALLRAASERPALLAVDDFDGAAPAVRALVTYLARTLPDVPAARLGLVVALRCDRPDDSRCGDWLAPYGPPLVTWLPPLAEEGVAAVLRRTFPRAEVPAALARALHRSTRGNPALLRAQLRALLAEGGLPVAGDAPLPPALPSDRVVVPATLEEAARRRIDALRVGERRLLGDIVWLGPPLPAALLSAVRAGPTTLVALARLVSAGLLERTHAAAGRQLDVTDAAVAEVLRAAPPDRQRLGWLRERVAAVAPDDAERLARLCAALGRTEEAARHALVAGRRLLLAGAAQDARAWLRRAIEWTRAAVGELPAARLLLAQAESRCGDHRAAAEVLAEGPPVEAAERRVERLLARAEHAIAAGDHHVALAALAAATAADDPRRLVLAARAHLLLGEHAAAEEHAAAARATLLAEPERPGAGLGIVRATTTLGLCAFYQGRYEAAEELLRDARAHVEAGAAPEERSFVLSCQGLVRQRRGDLAGAAGYYRESAEVARLRGDLARVAIAAVNLGTVAQEAGDLGAAIAAFEDAARTARRLDNRMALVKALLNLGNLRAQAGMTDAAGDAIAETLRLARAEGLGLWLGYGTLVQAELALLAGRTDPVAALVTAARSHFEDSGARRELLECDLVACRGALAQGDHAAAQALAARLAEEGAASGVPRFAAWGRALAADAELRRFRGDPEQAIAGFRAALEAGGPALRAEDRWPIAAGLAQALAGQGRPDEAAAHARAALAALDQLESGLPVELRAGFRAVPERRRAREALEGLVAPAILATTPTGGDDPFLQQILDLNKRLATEADAEGLLRTILDVAVTLTGAERGFVLLPAEGPDGPGELDDDAPLRVRVARNIDRETIQRRQLKVSTSIAREVFLTGSPLLSVDATEDDRLRAHLSVAAMRLRSVLCVPLRHRDAVIGVVYIDNRFQAGAFRSEHLRRLQAFADQAALALAGAQALERERQARAQLEVSQREVAALNDRLAAELSRRTAALEEAEALLRDRQSDAESRYDYRNIVGRSPAMRRLFATLDRVTDSRVPLLVTGESGTGKELVARAVHYNGPRRHRELVAVNCAALPETLLESELFGHARGAFTGADRERAGLVERADGGTLFLDELGDMPLTMQAKLLRVLESGEFMRVGETQVRRVDVRLVAATHHDLRVQVREGAFREDLLFRIDVVSVELPPLRERQGDLPLLAAWFLRRIAESDGRPPKRLRPDALALLETYAWPGNVRELESTLITLALMTEDEVITPADVAACRPHITAVRGTADLPGARGPGVRWDARSTMLEIERKVIADAIDHFGGRKAAAARALGLSRNRLYERLRELGR
jgi:transcriptional regulator with GAF, ATPase, and Fis domain/tetratricopeptide (TPR) repeat protein